MSTILMIFLIASVWMVLYRMFCVEKQQAVNHAVMLEILKIVSRDLEKPKEIPVAPVVAGKEKKQRRGNENPRTQEQRLQASLKRKAYWDKKKSEAARIPEDAAKLPEEGRIPLAATALTEEKLNG